MTSIDDKDLTKLHQFVEKHLPPKDKEKKAVWRSLHSADSGARDVGCSRQVRRQGLLEKP
jgi:hypothetical protein